MRTSLFFVALAFACLAGSIRAAEEKGADADVLVPVAIVEDESVAEVEAALNADVPLVRSKRSLLLLKKLKLAKLGLVGLGLGAAKVAVIGSALGGAGGGAGGLLGGLGGKLGGLGGKFSGLGGIGGGGLGGARPQVSTSVSVQPQQPLPQQEIAVQVVQQPHAQYGPPAASYGPPAAAARGGSLTARKEYVVQYNPAPQSGSLQSE